MIAEEAYFLSQSFTKKSLEGAGALKGEKGDKGDKLTFNDLTDEEKASLKGADGVSPTITENADNTDKIYKLDIETVDGYNIY